MVDELSWEYGLTSQSNEFNNMSTANLPMVGRRGSALVSSYFGSDPEKLVVFWGFYEFRFATDMEVSCQKFLSKGNNKREILFSASWGAPPLSWMQPHPTLFSQITSSLRV
jgi:hypothetical protein